MRNIMTLNALSVIAVRYRLHPDGMNKLTGRIKVKLEPE